MNYIDSKPILEASSSKEVILLESLAAFIKILTAESPIDGLVLGPTQVFGCLSDLQIPSY